MRVDERVKKMLDWFRIERDGGVIKITLMWKDHEEAKRNFEVNTEAVGIAGEFDFNTEKITPYVIYIGNLKDVEKKLNSHGGLDTMLFIIAIPKDDEM